ncbi:Serine-threonine/tyrosine-protein kinase, catalytic domain [Sesbania bispinosa]|nr:Serine-threonine/tyrosine-protein kinase, catalytic domain [Sesbania bispinosa]
MLLIFEKTKIFDCGVLHQVADITHSVQQPAGKKLDGGGVASGGLRELISCIARTAVVVGVDRNFMEVHDDPLSAPVDGPTQWGFINLLSFGNLKTKHHNLQKGGMDHLFTHSRRWERQHVHSVMIIFLEKDLAGSTGVLCGQKRFLVYEYMLNGNLQDHLNGINERKMDWPLRLKVALGAAKGLAYLQSSSCVGIPIFHRDLKSTNILLINANFEEKIYDFGLAKLMPEGQETRDCQSTWYLWLF